MSFVLDRSARVLERLRRLTHEPLCIAQHVGRRRLSTEELFGRSSANRSGAERTEADGNAVAAVAIELQLNTDTRHGEVTCSLFELDVRATGGPGRQADRK